MISRSKKLMRTAVAMMGVATAFTLVGPVGIASAAAGEATCDPRVNQVKVKYGDKYKCYSGVGTTDLPGDTWVSEVYAGEDNLLMYDKNGDTILVGPREAVKYNSRPNIIKLEIRPVGTAAPDETSSPIKPITCDPMRDQVKIRTRSGGSDWYTCYTGFGPIDIAKKTKIEGISTGSGKVFLYDDNGETVTVEARTNMNYPNHPPLVNKIEIQGEEAWKPAMIPDSKPKNEYTPAEMAFLFALFGLTPSS